LGFFVFFTLSMNMVDLVLGNFWPLLQTIAPVAICMMAINAMMLIYTVVERNRELMIFKDEMELRKEARSSP
jgi:hypothetical protein